MSEKRSEPNSPTTSDQPLETTTTTPESASHGHTQGVSFNTDSFEIQASYTIPFAPPHIIKEIEGTCPGYGAKVLDYAIDEQRHRQKLDIRLEDRLDAIERRKDRELERRSELNMIGLKEGESRGLTPHAAGLFRLLIYTGARLGDILNAQWAFWDRDARALRLPDSKTGKKNVWLNALAIGELEKLWAIRRQERWVIEGLRPGNRLVNPQKAWQRVGAAAARKLSEEGAAEEAVKTMTETRIHDLRHSYASFAVGSGLPLYLVGKALGHAEARTTERYAHIAENPIRDAADVVGDTIAQILDGSSLRPISRN